MAKANQNDTNMRRTVRVHPLCMYPLKLKWEEKRFQANAAPCRHGLSESILSVCVAFFVIHLWLCFRFAFFVPLISFFNFFFVCFDVWSKWIGEAKQMRMHWATINKQLDRRIERKAKLDWECDERTMKKKPNHTKRIFQESNGRESKWNGFRESRMRDDRVQKNPDFLNSNYFCHINFFSFVHSFQSKLERAQYRTHREANTRFSSIRMHGIWTVR